MAVLRDHIEATLRSKIKDEDGALSNYIAIYNDHTKRTVAEISAGVTPVNYAYPPGDVRRYGATGDGVTDDTAAIQNAINAVGVAGRIFFPIGTFLCAGSLTTLNFQSFVGECYEPGAGGSQSSLRCTLTSGVFMDGATSLRFENIRFQGVATYTDATGATAGSTAVAIDLDNDATFTNCVFQSQFICIQTHSCHYLRFYGGEVVRCGEFVRMEDANVFNLQIEGTIFRLCSAVTSSNDTPKRRVHNLKVIGGSFESWTGLFNCVASGSFFGTYFESAIVGGFGFNSDDSFTKDSVIGLYGCMIFLINLDRFVNFSGLTGGTFISIGNTIACATASGEDQTYFYPQDSGGRTVMMGDYLDDRGSGTFHGVYVQDQEKVRNQMIVWPRGTTADHANAGQTWVDGGTILKPKTLADSATPSVKGGTNFLTGGTTTITDFTDGVEGQEIRVLAEHSITITDGTNIFLAGSANFAMNSSDSLTLLCKADGNWYELSRSDNS